MIPQHFLTAIQEFHAFLRKIATPSIEMLPLAIDCVVGIYKLRNIANMDQTPLPFDFLAGKTYSVGGAKTVWVKGTAGGLDKRQATVQLCIFADGIARVKPMVVFRGKGLRIATAEKVRWDKRVAVVFQDNAWVDEEVTLWWIKNLWNVAYNSIFDIADPRMLVLDVHRAQKTEQVLSAFRKSKTTSVMVPPGCTSLVQPLDVSINKPFKQLVEEASEQHYYTHTEQWMQGKISVSERRILISQWVGEAWEKLSQQYKDTMIRSFRKCGISLPIDGSQDTEINIEGVTTYKTPDRGQFVAFNPRDPDAHFDYDSGDETTEPDTSDIESDTSSLVWNDIETLQLGEYILE